MIWQKYIQIKNKGPSKVLRIMFYTFFLQIPPSVFITVFPLILVLIYHCFGEKQGDKTLKGWFDKKSVSSKTKAHQKCNKLCFLIIFLSSKTYETGEENREIWPFFHIIPLLFYLEDFLKSILLKKFSMDIYGNKLIFCVIF